MSNQRKVSFTIPPGDHIYWVNKNVANITAKPTAPFVLTEDLTELYKRNPGSTIESELGEDYFVESSQVKKVKQADSDQIFYDIKVMTPVKDDNGFVRSKEVEGFIKSDDTNISKVSAHDWTIFGFEIFQDQPDEFVFNRTVEKLKEKNVPDFLKKVWKQMNTNGNKILDNRELAIGLKDEFVVKKLSKMICYHTSEWGLDYNSLQLEIEILLDEGIKKEKNADKKNKLNQKKELTLSNTKKKVEDLQFWSKVKVAIPNTISKIPDDYIFGPIRYQSRKRFFWEPNFGNNQEEEKEYTPFPISPKVYHFHPIAFVEQMKRMEVKGGYIDWNFIGKKEGKEVLNGYVPTKVIEEEVTEGDKDGIPILKDGVVQKETISKVVVIGKSGVTIATGFDIGQHNSADLNRIFESNPNLKNKYFPYALKRKQTAIDYLALNPLSVKLEEAKITDKLVKNSQVVSLKRVYGRYDINKEFEDQSIGVQTAVVSICFQYGMYSQVLVPMWNALENDDTDALIDFWKDKENNTEYKKRRKSEREFLEMHLNDYK